MILTVKNERRRRIEGLAQDVGHRLGAARTEMQVACNFIACSDPQLHARIRACMKEIGEIRDELYGKVWG